HTVLSRGNAAMAPVRLTQYLKAALGEVDPDLAAAPAMTPPAFRSEAAHERPPLRPRLMTALPTAILLALAGLGNVWRTDTAVTLDLVAERTSFVLGGNSAA